MITKNTALLKVEIDEGGTVFVCCALQLMEGEEILSTTVHRTPIAPGESAADKMAAALAPTGWPGLAAGYMRRIGDHIKIEHSTKVIAAYKAKLRDGERAS